MKSYLEVSVSCSEAQRELLLPSMIELGSEGFQETEESLLCYFDLSRWPDPHRLRNELTSVLRVLSSNAEIRFREFPEENWNSQWEQSLRPVEVGKNILIKPSYCDLPGNMREIVLEIDPKMSFGTGYHETTRLTLSLLERYHIKGSRVLDVGTGTGVLAIGAVKLGSSYALGIDIDDWSIENAGENVRRNHVEESVDISRQPVAEIASGSFDVICANLTLNTNLELLDEFRRILLPGGSLIVSGLLLPDRDQMVEGLRQAGFRVREELVENEWTAIAAERA